MGAPDVLAYLSAIGVQLSREGDSLIAEPRSALTDEARALIRAHKAELLASLAGTEGALPDAAAEARRQRVIAMLAERPAIRHALVTDDADPAYPDCVVLGIGIRRGDGAIYTADMIVPRDRYDGIALLDLVERHGGVVH
jgi:hypothetical protein